MQEPADQHPESVQGTNDDSILTARFKYVADEFLRCYTTQKAPRRSPLINRGYYIRLKLIRSIIAQFVSLLKGQQVQVVSLGAGFDTSFWALKSSNCFCETSVRWLETDFGDVVSRKAAIIRSEKLLRNLIEEVGHDGVQSDEIHCPDYTLVKGDLRDLSALSEKFRMVGIDLGIPTLVFAECVMTYMNPEDSSKLISWAGTQFSRVVYVTYEQIVPRDAFGHVMRTTLLQRCSPLLGISSYPTLDDQKNRYLSLGFESCHIATLLEHFNGLPREEILRVEGLEEFDEFEEWVIKCQHYFICAAVKDADPSKLLEKVKEVFPGESFLLRQDHGYSGGEAEDLALDPSSSWIVNIEPKVRSSLHKHSSMRQGHTSIFVQGVSVQGYSEVVVVFGGQCHNRLDDIKILGVGGEDLIWKNPTVSGATPAPRVFHAAVSFAPGKLLVVGGRGSPRKPVGDVCCLNLESMFWEKWELNWEGALQTLSRWRHSATLVQGGPQHGKVVIFGGRSVGQGRNEFRAHADVLLLDPKTRTIKELPTIGDQPPARYSHTLTGVGGGRMVLFGGMDESRVAYNDAYILDVDEGSWKLLETSGGVPYPVFSHSANSVTLPPEENSENSETPIPLDVYGDQRATHVVVIGGCSPLSRNYVHSLDLVSLQWKRLATGFSTFSGDALSPPQANPSVPLLFAKHTATLVSQNRLCIIGGGALCFSFGNYFNPVCVLRLRPDGKDIFPFLGVTARSIEEPAENSDFPFLGIGLPEGTKGEIKILESPSRGDFAELLLRREPVILRGLDFGPCKELWRDIGYLRKSEARAFSAREFTEENLDFLNKNYDFRTMPFGDIIDLIFGEEGACDPDQTPAKRYYFRSIGEDARKQPSDIRTAVPNLSKDFHVPEELSFASEREFSSILRVSSKHIRVWTHYDVMDNILCQVVGTKTVTLWHPNEVSNLYVDGSTSRVLDINNPDLKKFPRFACASSLVGTLQSGDILFLPSLWFHNTWTEDPSISINVFFKHLSDEMYEAKDLYGNKDLIIAEQAMAEVEKACERLGNLPAHYSQFYLRKLLSSVESHLVKK